MEPPNPKHDGQSLFLVSLACFGLRPSKLSRTATVKALIDAGVWGANGHNFKQALCRHRFQQPADGKMVVVSPKIVG